MEAVIVAGGLGTRLLPLTQHVPKHLLPVGGVPFVAHQLVKLAEADVRRVVLATSYHAEQFLPVLGDGSDWGVELVYVREEAPLGTAGAIRNVADHLASKPDEPIVILNGDILSGHDLKAQLDHHKREEAEVTLHLVDVPDARAFGCVPTTSSGVVTAFLEKAPDPVSSQINAGCYIFDRRVVDEIPAGRVVSVERETFPALLADGRRVVGYVDRSYWLDLGTPQALCRGSSDLVRGIATSPAYLEPPGEAWTASDAEIDPSAAVRGGSAVGSGAQVRSRAVLEASLVCPGAVIGDSTILVNSVVGPGARIGPGVVLRDAVVGDRAVVGAGCELLAGVRVWGGAVIPDGAIRFSSPL